MTNSSKWIEILKKIDKKNISFNEQGELFIRINKIPTDLTPLQSLDNSLYNNSKKLNTTLLYPEDRVARRPIIQWSKELLNEIKENINSTNTHVNRSKIAAVYNNAALISLSINEIKIAYELCYDQIFFFVNLSRINNDKRLLLFIIQPWINLIRLDRIERKADDFIYKHNILCNKKYSIISSGDNFISDCEFEELVNSDISTSNLISTCSALEETKYLLHIQDYQSLIKLADPKKAVSFNQAFIVEALIISLANTANFKESLEWIDFAKNELQPSLTHIFSCHEFTIRSGIFNSSKLQEYADVLLSISIRLMNMSNPSINDVLFSLHVFKILNGHTPLDKLKNLLGMCISTAKQMQDEPLLAECLLCLYKVSSITEMQLINQSLVNLYHQTSYFHVKNKIQTNFIFKLNNKKSATNKSPYILFNYLKEIAHVVN